jgi:NADH:ubiquinone oxidoreductase subunit 6 (subunit J)
VKLDINFGTISLYLVRIIAVLWAMFVVTYLSAIYSVLILIAKINLAQYQKLVGG